MHFLITFKIYILFNSRISHYLLYWFLILCLFYVLTYHFYCLLALIRTSNVPPPYLTSPFALTFVEFRLGLVYCFFLNVYFSLFKGRITLMWFSQTFVISGLIAYLPLSRSGYAWVLVKDFRNLVFCVKKNTLLLYL